MFEWILENLLLVISGLLIVIFTGIAIFASRKSYKHDDKDPSIESCEHYDLKLPSELEAAELDDFLSNPMSNGQYDLESLSESAAAELDDLFSDLTSSEQNKVCSSSESVKAEQVEFAVFSPERIVPNSFFALDVWAYLQNDYSDIHQLAKTLDRENVVGRKLGVPVERGSLLIIKIEIPGIRIQDPVDTIFWGGSPSNATFIVSVPQGVKTGCHPGKVAIAYNGISIAKISFLITIASEGHSNYTETTSNTMYPQTAFASYASDNRDEVLSRIQGMKKIAPNLDVFIDVFTLRSGENWSDKLEEHVPSKDIFYLFWSRSAAFSEWVEKEWRLALYRRGINYIDPVPLEEPDNAPPPQELASLHFHDAYLTYISYERLKRNLYNIS